MGSRPTVLVLAGCLFFAGLIPASAAGTFGPEEGVVTSLPTEMTGKAELTAQSGAARLDPEDAWSSYRLKADSIFIESHRERGVKQSALFGYVTQQDQVSRTIKGVDIRFDHFQGDPVMLAFDDGRDMDLSFSATGHVQLSPDEDVSVVEVGSSPDSSDVGEEMDIGFWYDTKGKIIKGESSGSLFIQGNFTLFVHNAYIHATGANDEWSDWTGYQEEDSWLPASEYEFRVTTIKVTDGMFVGSSNRQVDLFVPSAKADIDGTVRAWGISGDLVSDGDVFEFRNDPMHLDGIGSIILETTETEGPVAMSLGVQGDFEVKGASSVVHAPDSKQKHPPYTAAFLSAGGFLMLAVTTVGLVGLGVIRAPTESTREAIYTRWIRSADASEDEGRCDRASRHYKRAARVKPESGFAWYKWAEAELDAGRPEKADEIALRADLVLGVEHSDILVLRALAAQKRGDEVILIECLEELVDLAPGVAHYLLSNLDIKVEDLSSHARLVIESRGLEGDMNGYV